MEVQPRQMQIVQKLAVLFHRCLFISIAGASAEREHTAAGGGHGRRRGTRRPRPRGRQRRGAPQSLCTRERGPQWILGWSWGKFQGTRSSNVAYRTCVCSRKESDHWFVSNGDVLPSSLYWALAQQEHGLFSRKETQLSFLAQLLRPCLVSKSENFSVL